MKAARSVSRKSRAGKSSRGRSRRRSSSRLDLLAIDRAFAELGLHAPLCDVVSRAQAIEKALRRSHMRRKRGLVH